MEQLEHWLVELTGMTTVALSPRAGAHGELLGLMTIRSALEAQGNARQKVLVPESAHGTNPATAAQCGYSVETVAAGADGKVSVEAVREKLNTDYGLAVAALPSSRGAADKVYIAMATPQGVSVAGRRHAGHPDILIDRTAKQALDVLRLHLLRS